MSALTSLCSPLSHWVQPPCPCRPLHMPAAPLPQLPLLLKAKAMASHKTPCWVCAQGRFLEGPLCNLYPHSGKSRWLGSRVPRIPQSSFCRLQWTLWVWVGAEGLPRRPCLSRPQRHGCVVPRARPAPREPSSVPPAGPLTPLRHSPAALPQPSPSLL